MLKAKRPFTALMAFDDMTAFGAIRALGPEPDCACRTCSVIGFDDIAASSLCTPPLTTVRQPMEANGGDGGQHRPGRHQRHAGKARPARRPPQTCAGTGRAGSTRRPA